MPSLRRIPDGAGDSGTMSNALKIVIDENGKETVKIVSNRPVVGANMMVGSSFARTMRNQDWWCASEVIEIIEESEDYCKFKTKNSIYE